MEHRLIPLHQHGLPKVLRGLPRLYKWRQTDVSKIKENFDDFAIIKQRYLEKAELARYDGSQMPGDACVVLFTWVMEDGWGDYYTQLDAARILQKRFPDIELTLITLIHKNRALPQEPHPFTEHIFRYSGNARCHVVTEAFPEMIHQLCRVADLIVQLPTSFPHTASLLDQWDARSRHELIGEQGFIDSAWFHPRSGAHCMGLHFLEKGLFVREMPERPVVRGFNLDYTKTARGNYLFFHILLKALEHDPHPITIATPSLKLFIENLDTRIRPLLQRFAVSELVIFFKDAICPVPIQREGKKLFVRHIEHQKHEDFLALVSETDLLVGCTGDGSIAEALSAGKPFFYDPPIHKRNFLKDMIALAEDRLHEYPETVDYLKLSLKNAHLILEDVHEGWVSEEFLLVEAEKTSPEDTRDETIAEAMGSLLQKNTTREGLTYLSKIIQSEYALNPVLCQIVERGVSAQRARGNG